MISIVWQGDHRYNIYRSGQDIGCIALSGNVYHNQHCYLNLNLSQYDPAIAGELFSLLRKELRKPLQVMLYTSQEMYDFLIAGGFRRKRRCYEIEVTASDLAISLCPTVKLHTERKGSPLFDRCCQLLYGYYRTTHESVSPLTASQELFCSTLPETVLCTTADKKPIHCAFIDSGEVGYEFFYVATEDLSSFLDFAQSIVFELFQKRHTITAECDDTDPAAMQLMNLFDISVDVSYDTYILE